MKKFILLSVIAVLSACGGDTPQEAGNNSGGNQPQEFETIVAGGTTISVDVLQATAPFLEERGFILETIEFDDFNLPNMALADGDLDVNFFQHRPFLDNFNYVHGTDLVTVLGVYFVPLRLYAGQSYDLNNIPYGATIVVPDDLTNEARAMLLLESLDLIELEPGHGLSTTSAHITYNPHGLQITPMAANIIAGVLPDVDFGIINGIFALNAGVAYRAVEGAGERPGSQEAITFTNYVVVRAGDENLPSVQALVEAMQQDSVREFIYSEFEGTVIPLF